MDISLNTYELERVNFKMPKELHIEVSIVWGT